MRTQSLLLRGQIALTVALLAATGLITRSYAHLRQLDLGFDPQNVVTLHIEPQQRAIEQNEWMRELLTRVETMDGVNEAGAILVRPLALGAVGADTLVDARRTVLDSFVGTRQSRPELPSRDARLLSRDESAVETGAPVQRERSRQRARAW